MQLVEEPMEVEERRRELVEDKSGPVEVDKRPLYRSHQPRPIHPFLQPRKIPGVLRPERKKGEKKR